MIEYSKPLYNDFCFAKIIKVITYWTWQELTIGLEIEIITKKDIIEYAKTIIQEGTKKFDTVLQIAISNHNDDIEQFLYELNRCEITQSDNDIMDKWRFAMLLQLYLNRHKYKYVYEQVAEIGADFNHPKDMNGLIYYMPSNGYDLETSWINYLKVQSQRFNIDCFE